MAVALVLGARVLPDGRASPSLRRRADRAAALWLSGGVDAIIASGGGAQAECMEAGHTEAAVIARICREAGVPASVIKLEERARSTEENVLFALPLLCDQPGLDGIEDMPDVVIVTDLYHQPRARLVARRLGLVARSASPPLSGSRALPFVKAALREVPAYLWYWISGKGRGASPAQRD